MEKKEKKKEVTPSPVTLTAWVPNETVRFGEYYGNGVRQLMAYEEKSQADRFTSVRLSREVKITVEFIPVEGEEQGGGS